MTGRTERTTYAEIEPPVDEHDFTWTATIYRSGRKRSQAVRAFSEALVMERCRKLGVHRFVRV